MEKWQGPNDLRRSLGEILELSLKTARDIQSVLDDLASRQPDPRGAEHPEVTPDEGKALDSGR